MATTVAVVVLYFPRETLVANMQTYIGEVDLLLVIDNSEPPLQGLQEMLGHHSTKIRIISNGENAGIARALNQAARMGIENGFDWLLTMDQDSYFEQGALQKMQDIAAISTENVALLSPFHQTPKAHHKVHPSPTTELRMTMTSGNLLRLSAYEVCGPFEEKLFIDSVDHEYCLRLRKNGFKIVRVNPAVLHHGLGEIVYHRFLFFRLKTTNHSAVRRYYITRNRLYVMFRYMTFDLKFFRREFFESVKAFFAVLLFEEQKLKKTGAMVRGVWHFIIGRYGKI